MKKMKIAVYNVFKKNIVKRAQNITLARKKAEERLARQKESLQRDLNECGHYFESYLNRWNESSEFQEILKEAHPSDGILREFLGELKQGHTPDIAYYEQKVRAQYQLFRAVERNDEAAFHEALQNGANVKTVFAFHESLDLGGDFYYYTIIDNVEGIIRRNIAGSKAETDELLARYKRFLANS